LIHWVHVGVQVREEKDFQALRKLLGALGLRSRGLEDHKTYAVEYFLPSVAAVEVFHRKDSDPKAGLELTISDPDTAVEVVKKMGLEIVGDDSDSRPNQHFSTDFRVRLPGGTIVNITGFRTHKTGKGWDPTALEGTLSAAGKKFAIVASRFNSFIVERLLGGALDCLHRTGLEDSDSIDIVRVPGAFEIPSAARTLAETGKYDAIIALGCLLRGDTAHYDVIVNEVTRGIGQSAQETGVPHAFGVLTCDTLEQAIDRAGLKMGNKGFEAALAAIEMADLKRAVVGGRRSLAGQGSPRSARHSGRAQQKLPAVKSRSRLRQEKKKH
jgi:6,7-dimethyl-8-ribityllumazine synthase